jgi:hypothetical protein
MIGVAAGPIPVSFARYDTVYSPLLTHRQLASWLADEEHVPCAKQAK